MKLRFTKMHGAGNDFVVLDGISQTLRLKPDQIRCIADRHFGIGCDQVLLVEKSVITGADFRYRIFNADGGEVEQCGNGARCFVRFVHDRGLTTRSEIRVSTLAGVISPRLEADGEVTVEMGAPVFDPELVPFDSSGLQPAVASAASGAAGLGAAGNLIWSMEVNGATVSVSVLSMGNPHAVQVVADVNAAPVTTEGALIERHARFPRRVNAGYMQIVDRHHIRLRVWERGAGETLACGTGACAAVVVGICRGLLDSPVRVSTRGGELSIAWDKSAGTAAEQVNSGGSNHAATVRMTGPAQTVFEGEIEINE